MSSRSDDDKELVRQAQAGNVEAFSYLYDRHAPAIYRYLAAHLPDRLDAEDLTGEVFLRTWQVIPDFRERGVPFLAFLFRVARNAMIDYHRKANRTRMSISGELEAVLKDDNPGPAELTSSREEHQEVLQVLSQLHEDYQEVLVLRFLSELSVKETAKVMKRSQGSIRVLQHRALASLRALINDIQTKDEL